MLIDEIKHRKGFDVITTGMMRKYVKDVRRPDEKKKRGRKLPKPVVDEVKHFWEREDVSEYTAGKKKYITRAGEKRQRRYLTDSIKELHKKYNAHTHFQVAYSTFRKLRPFYVLPKEARNLVINLVIILFVSALLQYCQHGPNPKTPQGFKVGECWPSTWVIYMYDRE